MWDTCRKKKDLVIRVIVLTDVHLTRDCWPAKPGSKSCGKPSLQSCERHWHRIRVVLPDFANLLSPAGVSRRSQLWRETFVGCIMARAYGMIYPGLWEKGSGKLLRGDHAAQALAVYLMSCSWSSMTGIYRVTRVMIADELGMTPKLILASLKKLAEVGIAHYDAAAELVYLPSMAKHQTGERLSGNDKRITAIERHLKTVGDHPFAVHFRKRYGAAYNLAPGVDLTPCDRVNVTITDSSYAPPTPPSMGGSPPLAWGPVPDPDPDPVLRLFPDLPDPDRIRIRKTASLRPPAGNDNAVQAVVMTEFERFWLAYPRKVHKGAAERAWDEMQPPLQQCQDTLMWLRTSEQWTHDGGQYVPHPATWLRAKGWLDERPAQSVQAQMGASDRTMRTLRNLGLLGDDGNANDIMEARK